MRRTRLLAFEDEQARRGAYARRDAGFQTVPTSRIVGSVGRARELDGRFRYRSLWSPLGSRTREQRLRRLFESGRVPPLELYQIGDDLFVVDGHHRVRIALRIGQEWVDAHVVEHLPDRRDPANRVYYERQAFAAATGLSDVHVTEAGIYPKLVNRVRDLRHELAQRRGAPSPAALADAALLGHPWAPGDPGVDLRAAAREWHESELRPVLEVLAHERVVEAFPGRTPADVYGYLLDHRWFLSERRGWDVGLEIALADFVARHAPEPIAEAVFDPIVALGSDVLSGAGSPALLRWCGNVWLALGAGLLALPVAFLRGLRPRHYRFRTGGEAR